MDKRILKFLVKKEFARWAPLVDAVFDLGKNCIESREDPGVSNFIISLEEAVRDCVGDLKRRLGTLYGRPALSRRSRQYVKRRFAKEFLPYARFFVRELTFRSNMSIIASHSRRQQAMASVYSIQAAIRPLLNKDNLDISEDYELIQI
jgi:hypothetical protein